MSSKETFADDSDDSDTSGDRTEAQIWDEVQSARNSTSQSHDSEPEDASVPEEEIAEEPSDEGDDPAISEDPKDADDKPEKQRQDSDDKAKRLAGIVSARDKKLNQQNRKIRDLEERIAGFSQKDKPTARDISSLDELKETYPDLMDGIVEQFRSQADQIAALTEQVGSHSELAAERSRETYKAETDVLNEKMPDWEKTVKDNRRAFWSWVEDQPRADRDLAYSSQEHVVDGEGLHDLLSRFKTHLTGEVHPAPGSSEPESQRTNQRRLDGARTVPNRGSQAATTRSRPDESDEVALWNKAAAKLDKARRR